jgi:hypothetical protein
MWDQLFAGGFVSLVNFGVHGVITAFIVIATRHTSRVTDESHAFVRLAALMTVTMITLMSAHVVEIGIWAGYLGLANVGFKELTAFEFAFENYTALGYGDVVAVRGDRLIGPIIALNGLLLIGWSVAVIFEVMRMAELRFGGRD